MSLHFRNNKTNFNISLDPAKGEWLIQILSKMSIEKGNGLNYSEIKESYTTAGFEGFELFWDNKPISTLYKAGLLQL